MDNGSSPGGLEFAVLGPVEARRDGQSLPLGGLQQRALLALLVLQHGEVVSADRLIEDLFGPAPRDGSANALQQAVSRLRRTLGGRRRHARHPGSRVRARRRSEQRRSVPLRGTAAKRRAGARRAAPPPPRQTSCERHSRSGVGHRSPIWSSSTSHSPRSGGSRSSASARSWIASMPSSRSARPPAS